MAFKFNLGKSFRMPIAKELAANGVNYHYFSYEKGNAALDAEIAYQVDLGLSFRQGKWSVSLSPFYQYFPNYIYLNPTSSHDYEYGAGNQVFEYTQAQVLRYGGEISISYKPISILSAELSGEFLHSEQLSGSKKGFTLPFSPPTSVLANLSWSPNTGRNLSSSYLSIDYRITASQNQIVPPERKTPGYQLINIQFGTSLQWGRHTIALAMQVQNLMNTKCLNHTSFYRLIELPEAGRNFILSLRIPIQFT